MSNISWNSSGLISVTVFLISVLSYSISFSIFPLFVKACLWPFQTNYFVILVVFLSSSSTVFFLLKACMERLCRNSGRTNLNSSLRPFMKIFAEHRKVVCKLVREILSHEKFHMIELENDHVSTNSGIWALLLSLFIYLTLTKVRIFKTKKILHSSTYTTQW